MGYNIKIKLLVALGIINLFSLFTVYAQETQVPMDLDSKVDVIDSQLEAKLALFTKYQEFVEAKLFKSSDNSYFLEISYKIDKKMNRLREPMTESQVQEFRKKVSQCIADKCPIVLLDQEGRTELVLGTTLLGIGAWGWMLPVALDIEDSRSFVATYLLAGAASFFAPFLLTQNSVVTDGMARLSVYGGISGIAHGLFLNNIFRSGNQYPTVVLLLTSLAESYAGYQIASNWQISEGKADVLTAMATFGLGYGCGTAYVLDGYDTEQISAGALIGTGAGYLIGNLMANSQNYSRGDAAVMSTAGGLGAYISLAAMVMAEVDDSQSFLGGILIGGAASIYAGDRLVVGKNFSNSQGSFITLSTIAGGLTGAALAYIITAGSSDIATMKTFVGLSALGAASGYYIMYDYASEKAVDPAYRSSLNIDINPFGVASIFRKSWTPDGIYSRPSPMLNLSYKF
ncbi:MAG: hypothetical protein HW421_3458 [Ignavibacteria bacterium]|nr:hypothetical protein [Ignavibacteria bacterium]